MGLARNALHIIIAHIISVNFQDIDGPSLTILIRDVDSALYNQVVLLLVEAYKEALLAEGLQVLEIEWARLHPWVLILRRSDRFNFGFHKK